MSDPSCATNGTWDREDDDEWICGESYDHDFPEPEYVDGIAALVCRECGGEILLDEEDDA